MKALRWLLAACFASFLPAHAAALRLVVAGGDSLSAPNLIMGPAWPEMVGHALRAQGVDAEVVNLSIDGMTFNRSMTQAEFGTTMYNRAVTLNPDWYIVALGGNDGLFNIDNQTPAQMQASAYTYFYWLHHVVPAAGIIFVRIQAVPPGAAPAYDAFLDFCTQQIGQFPQSLVVTIPYYQLRDPAVNLLLPDGPLFNLGSPPLAANLPSLHPTAVGRQFMAAWFLKGAGALLGYQAQGYAPWNDPDQAVSDLKAGGTAAQVLRANWNQ